MICPESSKKAAVEIGKKKYFSLHPKIRDMKSPFLSNARAAERNYIGLQIRP